jgi:Resolvase, N terminal domain
LPERAAGFALLDLPDPHQVSGRQAVVIVRVCLVRGVYRHARRVSGYVRCSTAEQDVTAERLALLGLGVAEDRIYLVKGLTGTNRARPGLAPVLAAVRAGDTIVGTKLDLFARSVPDARGIGDSLVARKVRLSLCGTIYDRPTRWGRCLSSSWPPSPSSGSTCCGCVPARAWPSRGPRAGCGECSRSCSPGGRSTSPGCTALANTRSPHWLSCSPSPGLRRTGSWNASVGGRRPAAGGGAEGQHHRG